MHTNIKRLLNHLPTARALFRCVSWFNQHDHTTSILSFVRGVLYQLTPSGIRNAFCQAMILKHVLDMQIFKSHEPKTIYQLAAFLMSKVLAPVGNALMNVLYSLSAFCSFGCAFLCLREFALRFCKFLFIPAEETGIINSIPIREFRKTLQAHVDPDCQIIAWQGFGFNFASEAGIPIANCVPLKGERFDFSFDGTMKNHFDGANFRDSQTMIQELKAKLLESEAIVPAKTTETRIARFLARFHSVEESLESQIHSLLNILQNLGMNTLQFRMFLLPNGEQFICVIQRERLLLLLPSIFSSGKRLVINPTAKFQRLNQFRSLALGWLQTILEGFHQRSDPVDLDILLVFDVLLQDRNWRTTHSRNEIRMCPQGRQSTFQARKFSAKQTRTQALDPLHKFMNAKLRVNLTKDMNMVWHYFQFQNFATQFLCNLIDDCFHSFIHAIRQYLATVLRTKDNMIFAGV